MSSKKAFAGCKIRMLIIFLLVGGFVKFKVLQKAYFDYIKNIALNLGRGVQKGSLGLA